jgi:GTPase
MAFIPVAPWAGTSRGIHSSLSSRRNNLASPLSGNPLAHARRRAISCRAFEEGSVVGIPSNGNAASDLMLGVDASAAAGRSCGFAALLGPSNSGKSTLLNLLVGSKVAIVTPKVQTTRCRIAGIVAKEPTMVIYLDTPGIFKPNGRLDRAMVRSAWSSANAGDVVAIVVDAAQVYHGGRRLRLEGDDVYISEALEEVFARMPKDRLEYCICLNKIDTIEPHERSDFLACFRRALDKMGIDGTAATIFSMSARDIVGIEEFTHWVRSRMPQGPWLYPEDDLTDMPMRLLAAEVTREKVFMLLKQELPYEIAIETTSYKEQRDGSIRITQDILVNRASQKKIVTGQAGSMVKAIGMAARTDLSDMTGGVVHLMMTVKVREKWKEDSSLYGAWGLDYNA